MIISYYFRNDNNSQGIFFFQLKFYGVVGPGPMLSLVLT